jgi:hypothetical protein
MGGGFAVKCIGKGNIVALSWCREWERVVDNKAIARSGYNVMILVLERTYAPTGMLIRCEGPSPMDPLPVVGFILNIHGRVFKFGARPESLMINWRYHSSGRSLPIFKLPIKSE